MSAGGSLLGGSGYPRRRARPADGTIIVKSRSTCQVTLNVDSQATVDYDNVTLQVRETNMETTRELYQQAKAAAGAKSDYAFAQTLGVTRSAVSLYANGKATFNDDHAAVIAGILRRDEGEIMAICAAERAKDANSRSRWLRVAALLAASVLPPAAGATSHNITAFSESNQSDTWHYVKR